MHESNRRNRDTEIDTTGIIAFDSQKCEQKLQGGMGIVIPEWREPHYNYVSATDQLRWAFVLQHIGITGCAA
jgi:hypothetical protein